MHIPTTIHLLYEDMEPTMKALFSLKVQFLFNLSEFMNYLMVYMYIFRLYNRVYCQLMHVLLSLKLICVQENGKLVPLLIHHHLYRYRQVFYLHPQKLNDSRNKINHPFLHYRRLHSHFFGLKSSNYKHPPANNSENGEEYDGRLCYAKNIIIPFYFQTVQHFGVIFISSFNCTFLLIMRFLLFITFHMIMMLLSL